MRKGQSLLNYSVLLMTIGLAFYSMSMYFERGIQGRVAALSDAVIAPREDHVGLIDESLVSHETSSQTARSTTTFLGDGAQSISSFMEVTSSSYTETTDEDYVDAE